ncbi:hypothetical protein ABH994_006588 [Bradyrhizobium yuanmingense]|jgi:hypothetical protein|uniref:hypothetical protein n=1 Tax=Bradyrhizobium yuanmingense TaxID=108015 RepID=UPI003512D265
MKRNQKNQTPHAVYVVEGEGDSAFWTKIGAAWPHQDGKGFNIQLSCMPLNGRLIVREPKAEEAGR